MINHLFIQFIGILIVAYSGNRLKSLTTSGALATVLVGSAVSIGFGYRGLLLLGLFFASSSLWSKFKKEKKGYLENKVQKGEQRDYVQVFANGGVPAIVSIANLYLPHELWLYIFIGAICSANADTWASEIGSLSKKAPILITTLRRVEAGTSGAISSLGTMAALGGSILIAVSSLLLWNQLPIHAILFLAIIGFIGNFLDTILGALVQVKYVCSVCKIETEKTDHCGRNTNYLKGLRFCNNDFINFASIIIASVLGGVFLIA